MEKLLNKLERKIGRYAIRNLSLFLIIAYAIGYVFTLISMTGVVSLLDLVVLDPYKIMHGQVWRIFSWVLVPPSNLDFFTIIMLYFYYSIGTTLERTWGAFRYNVYIFSGIIFSVIGAFLLYAYYVGYGGMDSASVGSVISMAFNTYYINLSIFLAFAAVYPDTQVLLFFIVPVKMKWMGILDVVLLAYSFIVGSLSVRVSIVMSLLNFIVFFFGTRNYQRVSPKEIKRRRDFARDVRNVSRSVTKHKCAICGRTERDGADLEFRFCSKCNGNYEYCKDHLFTHEHIK